MTSTATPPKYEVLNIRIAKEDGKALREAARDGNRSLACEVRARIKLSLQEHRRL